ncbi:MAG: nucleotide sugar dehydrogenase [Caulobacterales bacterium]
MNEVVVIGCGGVGLPLGVALASRYVRVLGVEIDSERTRRLCLGDPGLEDSRLAGALRTALDRGLIKFAETVEPADSERTWVIATPTPVGPDLRLDDRAIKAAFATVLAAARDGDLVMIRSTVPVGTTRAIANCAAGCGLRFAACPDRTVAGNGFAEQLSTPHIVGGLDEAASNAAATVLAALGKVIRVSSPETAEALKLFTNVWRDGQFALANQLALYCDAAGLDFGEIRTAGRMDFPRFDPPRAGPVGGPCLTKDVHLLSQSAEAVGVSVPLLADARLLNESLIDHVANAVVAAARGWRTAPRVAVLGLAFKGVPPTLDRRGSVGLALLERLRAALPRAELRGWDPQADEAADDGVGATTDADLVILCNDHPALGDARRLGFCARGALVYDLCGVAPQACRADLRVRRFGTGLPL